MQQVKSPVGMNECLVALTLHNLRLKSQATSLGARLCLHMVFPAISCSRCCLF